MLMLTQAHLTIEKITTKSGYAEIKLEDVDVVKDYNTILHVIDPKEIADILTNLENNIKMSDLEDRAIFLEHQIDSIRNKIQTLTPHKQKRGLFNFVGTIHKWLYGTMDDADRQELEQHLDVIDSNNHNIIQNVNSQVKINKNFNETFQKIKETIEKDRKILSDKLNSVENYNKVIYRQILYTDFALKLKILQDNVEQIQDNIASARVGIIHSNILTNEEILEYKVDFQKLQNIKLGVVLRNNDNLIFVIRIPKEIITLEKMLLIPISDDSNKELSFSPLEIVKYKNQTFSYIKDKDLKNLELCNNCLIKRNCERTLNNMSEIIELREGTILAKNQRLVKFNSTCNNEEIILNGNYIINFSNCSIKINNYVVQDNRKSFKQKFIIPNYLENIKNLNKKLMFDDIILQQVENIKEIKELKYEGKAHYIYSITSSIIFVSVFVIIAIYIYILKSKKSLTITNKFVGHQESPKPKEGGVMSAKILSDNDSKIPSNIPIVATFPLEQRDQALHFNTYHV